MLIFAINPSQSFKGLWGGKYEFHHADDSIYCSETIYHYFPFKDESKDQIEFAKKKYESHYNAAWYEAGGTSISDHTFVYEHDRLPFTAEEFKQYREIEEPKDSWPESIKLVSTALTTLGLFMHCNATDKKLLESNSFKNFFKKLLRVFKK